MAAVREASSGLSSPGPDSDVEHLGSRPVTAHGTPLRTPLQNADRDPNRPPKNKESPGADDDEDDDGQPAKKKRHRRTRADLEADKQAAELYPTLYSGKKNPKPINPRMKRPPLPGEPGYMHNPTPERLQQYKVTEGASAPPPPISMSPYAAGLPPDQIRRENVYAPSVENSPARNGHRDSHHNSPIVRSENLHSSVPSQQTNPSPRTHYDPIRGYAREEAPRPIPPTASPLLKVAASTPILNRASASPAISSLIDPPEPRAPPPNHTPSAPFSARPILATNESSHTPDITAAVSSSIPDRYVAASNAEYPSRSSAVPVVETPKPAAPTLAPRETIVPDNNAMEVDSGLQAAAKPHSSRASISSGASPHIGPAKPKEKREKPPLPPLPGSGSGLLTSAMLGIPGAGSAAGSVAGDEPKPAPVIEIEVKLDPSGNNIINFNRLAEQRYGFNALHPKLAAQKERLARVAAAGAMLENEARARAKGLDPDAMSEDLSGGSDDEKNGDSNAENTTNEQQPKRKKRNFKEDNYDKDDPFVDDSEMGMDEQTALATDGFFVYCGPLVDENSPLPKIQGRPDGIAGATGRGRGRGRGSRGGPGSRGGRVPGVEGSGTGRGGGPGSRGGRGRGGRGRGGRGAANTASPSTAAARDAAPAATSVAANTDLANYLSSFQAGEFVKNGPQQTPSKVAPAQNNFVGSAGRTAPEPIVVD